MSYRKITEQELRDKLEQYQTKLEAIYISDKLRMRYQAKIELLQELISEL